MKTEKEWLTTGDIVKMLGVTRDTVRKWADDGELPSARFAGGIRRYRRTDIDAFIAKAFERGKDMQRNNAN